CMQVTQLLTF
nr:immunoglobulin light chain junction region [Macaca mulatta]